MQPTAWLCDFDGTISPGDIGAELLRAFSPGRDAEREALLADWSAGRIGHRVLSTRECALMTMTEPEALGVARSHELDPAFAPFVREVEARGDAVMVVSEGFGFYISGLLQREGLTRVRWAANRMIFEAGGRVVPERQSLSAATTERTCVPKLEVGSSNPLADAKIRLGARYAGSLSPSGGAATSNALTTPHSIA